MLNMNIRHVGGRRLCAPPCFLLALLHTHLLLLQDRSCFSCVELSGFVQPLHTARQLAGTTDSLISFCFHPLHNTVSRSELSPDLKPCRAIGATQMSLSQLTGTQASDWARVSQSTSSCSWAESVQTPMNTVRFQNT